MGKRKALVVGLDYQGNTAAVGSLPGCANDLKRWRSILEKSDHRVDHVQYLPDGGKKGHKQEVLDGLQWLLEGADPDDTLFFIFSGHSVLTWLKVGNASRHYPALLCWPDREDLSDSLITANCWHHLLAKYIPSDGKSVNVRVFLDTCYATGFYKSEGYKLSSSMSLSKCSGSGSGSGCPARFQSPNISLSLPNAQKPVGTSASCIYLSASGYNDPAFEGKSNTSNETQGFFSRCFQDYCETPNNKIMKYENFFDVHLKNRMKSAGAPENQLAGVRPPSKSNILKYEIMK